MRSLRVAVAGLGIVGSETVRLLRSRRDCLRRRIGAPIELAAVCDRRAPERARRLGLPASVRRLTDPRRLPALRDVDVFVELLGGLDEPRRLALACLRAGRCVVTANKRLLARCWDELRGARARGGGRLWFEASVAGAVPVLRAIESSLAGDRITAVHGILNGTANFMLSRMEEGLSPEAALRRARKLGLAEKDPSLDLDGRDAADKVSVLASLVTGAWLDPRRIPTRGIRELDARDIAFAGEVLGRRARLLGMVRLDGPAGRVEACVSPFLVPREHPLAAVRDEFNAVMVRAASAGELMFYGKGAGAGPAASAVLGDIVAAGREILSGKAAPPAPPAAPAPRPAAADCAFYLRLSALDRPGVLCAITSKLSRFGVSIATIHQPATGGRDACVMITTHPAKPEIFGRALRAILALPAVSRRHAVMRLLS
ncbi:MAG: homoserine dehydrogenase [Elusimicrobia bacterium]|nr:homoserine dehydrogenase [Elusimicrobiota bacterium]